MAQIAISAAAPRVVYAAGGAGVFRSDDAGDTWRDVSGSFNAVTELAIDPTNADVVYATTTQSIYKSADGGASWHDVTAHLPAAPRPSALLVDPANHSTVYLGSRCGPIGFKTGSAAVSAAAIATTSVDPRTGTGVFKSVDSGDTWTAQSQGFGGRSFSGWGDDACPRIEGIDVMMVTSHSERRIGGLAPRIAV